MKSHNPSIRQCNILIVLVVYHRALSDVLPWNTIASWLERGHSTDCHHCLIYDNSPEPFVDGKSLPDNVTLIWNPKNGGTANAYAEGAKCAAQRGYRWLLLLDQDTVLPSDYLDCAQQSASAMPKAVALVPRIRHGFQLVSPATITPWGSVRPDPTPQEGVGMTTAISSGMFIRRSAIASIRFPPDVWLDYVDHWICRKLADRRLEIGIIDVDLSHDLSIRTPKTLSSERLLSILAAEGAFYRILGRRARFVLPFRRIVRAVRYLLNGRPSLAIITVCQLANKRRAYIHD